MPAFAREHLRPLVGSAGLHLLLLALVAGVAFRWTSETQPVRLALEGTVVDARDLPRSLRTPPGTEATQPPRYEPRPPPQPAVPEEPQPSQKAAEQAAARIEAAAEAKAAARVAAEQQAAEKQAAARRAEQEAQARKQREQAAAAEAARRKAEAESKARADAEAREKQAAAEQAAREAKVKADREARLKRELAAEESNDAFDQSGVVDEYKALLTQAIERNWIRPPSARPGLECTLNVTQATGGTVIDVQVAACNGDEAVRESITNAVYRSSPLPAPRDPRAFQRRLVIVFKPKE